MEGIASPGVGRTDSIGRVAADWETGADDAGNFKCCSRSYELVAIRLEACTVAWGKSIIEVFECGFGWVGDATWFVDEGIKKFYREGQGGLDSTRCLEVIPIDWLDSLR